MNPPRKASQDYNNTSGDNFQPPIEIAMNTGMSSQNLDTMVLNAKIHDIRAAVAVRNLTSRKVVGGWLGLLTLVKLFCRFHIGNGLQKKIETVRKCRS